MGQTARIVCLVALPVLLLVGVCLGSAYAEVPRPKIVIIIDDLGNLKSAADQTLALPGPVAVAILPHTPWASYISSRASEAGKAVLLHLPLEPIEAAAPAGIGRIDLQNNYRQLAEILDADLRSIPGVQGVNNHMGSLLTQHPGHMAWLMRELRARGSLYFVDSYTTPASVALRVAFEEGVPAARRDVFLDNDLDPAAIAREFARLKQKAREAGSAIAIGHPYPATLRFLQSALPRLASEGFDLVSPATVLRQPPLRVLPAAGGP